MKVVMPRFDRTGPKGRGSKTGRGLGECIEKKIQKVLLTGQTGLHEEDQGEGGVSGIKTGILKVNKSNNY